MRENVVVCVSGGGRSLENLLKQQEKFHYRLVGVVASRLDCKAVDIALAHKIPVLVADFVHADLVKILTKWLKIHDAHWIVLAGFLKKFPFLGKSWNNRVINIHPALLPKYGGRGMYGMRVHQAVVEARENHSGATVHFVNEEYDEGEIIAQTKIEVSPGDFAEDVAKKVFAAECALLPQVIEDLVQGKYDRRKHA